ncbi:Retinoic acid induced 16-like protein-domain-containing protein [Phellopilus nigrolimitatus]|nr:Retinoic acid induced 16-like protein-domain-containing protein [Phellopilus nigrolimitatus]
MDYFSKFLRPNVQPGPKQVYDHAAEFHKSWTLVKETLTHPDERQLARGIQATEVPAALKSMVDSLVWESTRIEEGLTGACMEYLLKNDVLGTLVRLSEPDRPSGIQAEVLRTVQNMVVLLDEQFLVHSVVHRAVLRLLKTCVGDDIQEQLDGRRVMGAAGTVVRTMPSEYEEDLVDLLCLLCSRIRTFRELLMIFFYDKHWYHSEALAAVPEDDEDEEEAEGDDDGKSAAQATSESSSSQRAPSPTPSQATVTSAPVSSQTKKPEYEFLLFNYLLRFVHREGKIGDFARAGLLFLMDVAMSPGVPVHRLGGDGLKESSSSSSSLVSQVTASDPISDAALALAEYILDGDFCEVLSAGLGAVYSLLPSKLEIRTEPPDNASHSNVMTIGSTGPLSEEEKEKQELTRERALAIGTEYSSSPEFKARLEHFIKLLEFFQDVLRRNVSGSEDDGTIEPASFVGSAIVQTILEAVRRIFLENVLYPSILECSDADGSAVAVMSYIDVMFRTLQDPQFAETLIDFLVSEDDTESSRHRPRTRHTLLLDGARSAPPPPSAGTTRERKMKRRKSSAMMLLEMEAPDARRQSEYFTSMGRFTLKDLLLTNMRSKSHPTVMAALQLMQSLLTHHCHLTVDRLLIFSYDPLDASSPISPVPKPVSEEEEEETFTYPGAQPEPAPESNTSFTRLRSVPNASGTAYSMHERELGLYLGLVARIDPAHGQRAFSTGYDHYLQDALTSLASHSCSMCATDSDRTRPRHILDVNDPVLSLILQSLRHFYSNTPELNMSLTGMLAAIATCPERSLKGWLLFGSDDSLEPPRRTPNLPQFLDDGDDRSVDFGVNERLSRNELPMPIHGAGPLSQPVLLSILQGLVSNIDRFRDLVEDFDSFLSERRQGLVFSENLTDALSLTFDLSDNVTGMMDTSRLSRSVSDASPPHKQKQKSRSGGWASFLSSRKSKSRAASPTRSEQGASSVKGRTIEASPFGSHYQKTNAISVEPLVAPLPASGPWVPSEKRKFNADEEDAFGSSGQWDSERRAMGDEPPRTAVESEEAVEKTVSLSQLLDNVVILEESIKELTATIHARRSLGIDSIRYL